TFNAMIGRLEAAFGQLRTAFEQQRRFTSDASHELRTPLTAIKANTSLALNGPRTAEEYRLALTEADQAADLMTRTVQDLLLLARSDAGQLAPQRRLTAIGPVLRRALSVVGPREEPSARLDLPSGELHVLADEQQLTRLFANLLENAIDHT